MYQRKVDVDMLNAVKSVLADVSSVGPSSEQGGIVRPTVDLLLLLLLLFFVLFLKMFWMDHSNETHFC